MKTTKCEATRTIRKYGKPLSKANTCLLRCQINTIKFEDGTSIRHLPTNKSYKMLDVQINPMLNFRGNLKHPKHVTADVRQLAKILTKRLLSPDREKQVID